MKRKQKPTKDDRRQLLLDILDLPGSVSISSAVTATVHHQPGGAILVKPGKVMLEGSVSDAKKALGLPNAKLVIRLIQDGEIDANKPRKTSPNCKYRVNMLTVYALKEKWEKERADARA